MQAIILAAGMGRRLRKLTHENTKCMIQVNGETLIERMLRQIEKCGVSRIVIVVGYKSQKLMEYIETLDIRTPVEYIYNGLYSRTNNIYSLWLARDYLCEEDTLIFESDLIFEDSVLEELVNDERKTLVLVDKYENWMDGTCVKLDEEDGIAAFIPVKQFRFEERDEYYKTVNIYKFSRSFSQKYYVPFLDAYSKVMGHNEYYEQVLRVITMLDKPVIKAKRLTNQLWYEIDDIQDLDIACSIFMPDAQQRVNLLQRRYGGYWRYPKLIDFSYLVNPYFPPQKLMDEIKANFEDLLTRYPSGLYVNSLLAAKNFDVPLKNIVVGNGASELIKSLMEHMTGMTGIIRPTFEEYPNRYSSSKTIAFWPQSEDFSYGTDDIIGFFKDKSIENLIVINPDNPTGNYIRKSEMLKLIDWCGERGTRLILDESFADFADEADNSLIKEDIISDNPHVFIIKSISKSYGVPGLRLGIMVSGDEQMINTIKHSISIWNINSFAEFYMQIAEKYHSEYIKALESLREERRRFERELRAVKDIRVLPSQANYIMLEIIGGMSARDLTKRLLFKYELFVKDLTVKMKSSGREFVRVSVRNAEDNDRLISALRNEMER